MPETLDGDWRRLRGLYAAMGDQELTALAAQRASLTPMAQRASLTPMAQEALDAASLEVAFDDLTRAGEVLDMAFSGPNGE